MATHAAAPSGKTPVDWKQYAADARDLFLATSCAGPLAMGMWGLAWRDWLTAVITAQDQFARRWTSLVVDPGARAKTFDQMRQDFKGYMVEIAGIPERAMLGYLERLSQCAGPSGGPPSPESAFGEEAADFTEAAADLFFEIEKVSEPRPASGGTWREPAHTVQAAPAHPASAHAAPDPLASLREKLDALRKAQAKLRAGTAPSAS